jgi:4a-hydroxytetrahydrobiopterin dehydratase
VLLSKRELASFQKNFPDWQLNATQTKATVTLKFKKHIDALVFIARSTVHAEVLQHHPDILYTHAKAKFTTTTHDAKGLTKKDIELVKRIEHLFVVSGE